MSSHRNPRASRAGARGQLARRAPVVVAISLTACATAPPRAASSERPPTLDSPSRATTPVLTDRGPAAPAHTPAGPATGAADDDGPWRLDDFLGTPDWLTVRGHTRARYERVEGQYAANPAFDADDQVILQRTAIEVEAGGEDVAGLVEIMDSRQRLAGPGTRIGTGDVNTAEVVQAYVEFDLGELGAGSHRLRVGRETLDVGSRRLVARPRYRNTMNNFTGLDWLREGDDGTRTRAFWLMPVLRRPGDRAATLDNDIDDDTQSRDFQLYGVHHDVPLGDDARAEVYAFALEETDLDTRRRSLLTPGARLHRKPASEQFDYELEAALQFGDSRRAVGGPRLTHRADMQHASMGYTFAGQSRPRVMIGVTRASGDSNPGDSSNERFDPLFGVRREWGPTSMWPGVRLSNVVTPVLGLDFRPTDTSRAWLSHRWIWLEESRDTFTGASTADPSGATGDDVAKVLEARYRVDVVPRSVQLEFGAVYQWNDDVITNAPNSVVSSDSKYGYAQATWTF